MNNTVQGTEAWRQARCGKATASRVSEIIARTKSGWGASRENYLSELVCERLTGVPVEGYRSQSMERGSDTEASARAAYELRMDTEVTLAGFVQHPLLAFSGASPDGLVGTEGVVEFKCPELKTHIGLLLGDSVPKHYQCQMQWEMECTQRPWCDFVSYNPLLPPEMRLYMKRHVSGGDHLDELRHEVPIFLKEVEVKVAKLLWKFGVNKPSLRDLLEASL